MLGPSVKQQQGSFEVKATVSTAKKSSSHLKQQNTKRDGVIILMRKENN